MAANLAALQKAYGAANCSVLRINTAAPGSPPGAPPEAYRRVRKALLPGVFPARAKAQALLYQLGHPPGWAAATLSLLCW